MIKFKMYKVFQYDESYIPDLSHILHVLCLAFVWQDLFLFIVDFRYLNLYDKYLI